jgi:hypothetical protein
MAQMFQVVKLKLTLWFWTLFSENMVVVCAKS